MIVLFIALLSEGVTGGKDPLRCQGKKVERRKYDRSQRKGTCLISYPDEGKEARKLFEREFYNCNY